MRPPAIPTTIPINKEIDSKQIIIMKSLYNTLIEYREPLTQRCLIQPFICLPTKRDYPEYYEVVEKPIAMNKIRYRIERQIYLDESACMADFRLMFSNCKFFNEESSTIYKDVLLFEEILTAKRKQLLDEYNNSDSKCSSQNHKVDDDQPTTNHNNHHDSNDSDTQQSASDISSSRSRVDNQQITSEKISNEIISEDSTGFNSNNNHHDTPITTNGRIEITDELLDSTPIEKCSLNNRRGRNSEAPKRQLLTGYIIYASEVRKDVIDRNPDQTFGDISRLVGNEWKALPRDIRLKYDQRALIHNKRVRERLQRESLNPELAAARLSNDLHTPKSIKKKLAKLAKEQKRLNRLAQNASMTPSNPDLDQSSSNTSLNFSSSATPTQRGATSNQQQQSHHQLSQQPQTHQAGRPLTVETATQTTALRFVEPPAKKRLTYSETFRKYIQGLQINPNHELLDEELGKERSNGKASEWLGAGVGRHRSAQNALWALREFMLQDADSMRRSLLPYLEE